MKRKQKPQPKPKKYSVPTVQFNLMHQMPNFRKLHADATNAEEQLFAKIIEEQTAIFDVDEMLADEDVTQIDLNSIGFAVVQICVRHAAWSIRRSLAETQFLGEQINGVS